jgi:uncharacterized protein YbjT (DUF2867 family)
MTTLDNQPILVIGATGRQGGASARHLLAQDSRHLVRALVRDPSAPAARALADRGAELVRGDLDDRASIERALDGVYGVHLVQAYMPDEPEREVRRGTTVVDLARTAGVRHFVYSSAAGADRHIGIPETESKWTIEEHLRSSGLPATILRPAYFMDNFEFMKTWILQGVWSMSLPPERSMQMIAAEDIGAFVALAFVQPADFVGRSLDIAGDELTMLEVAETLGRIIGRGVTFNELSLEQTRGFDPNLATLCEWMRAHDFGANIAALRALIPDLLTLEAWLATSGWSQPASEPVALSSGPV